MNREAAFAEAYTAHFRRVRGLCRQLLGSTDRAEDAAQEAFIRAYRAFASYDSTQPFAAWIMKIARNPCLDLLRRRSTEKALFGNETEEVALAEAPEPDGLGAVLGAERASAVNAAVAKLPERYRVPLALAYYADADYSEIASQLGLTRTHVGVLLCRAKQLLRQSLADAGMDTRAGATQEALAEGSP
jgi:RNA polymerase sigma-70 factor (ECF subfamily)